MIRKYLVIAAALVSAGAHAAPATWTDWTSISGTSATGTMGGVSVNVSATQSLNGVSQTSCGTNYWTGTAYTNGTLDNGPTGCEQVGLNVANTVTVTFGTAIDNLYMALISVGQLRLPVTYTFDQSFGIDSTGTGYWDPAGNSTYNLTGNALTMSEFHGVVRFSNPVTSLTFSTAPNEFWHAFTFGTATVPEPGSLALAGLALAGLGVASRRRKTA